MREISWEILAWLFIYLLVFLRRGHLCDATSHSCNSYLENMENSLPKHYLFWLRRQSSSITVDEKAKLVTESLCRFLKENREKEFYDKNEINAILACINTSCPSVSSSMEEMESVSMEDMDMLTVRHFRCMVANMTGGDRETCATEKHETYNIRRFITTSSTAEIKGKATTPRNSFPPSTTTTTTTTTTTIAITTVTTTASRESRTSSDTLSDFETQKQSQMQVSLLAVSLMFNVILLLAVAYLWRRRNVCRPETRQSLEVL